VVVDLHARVGAFEVEPVRDLLLHWSTALRISTWFTSETISNDGMIFLPFASAAAILPQKT